MKSIKKIITAAAAAAVIATVGATTAFAISNAANSVDAVQNTARGNYMELDYGRGYARTTNINQTTRLANASVIVTDQFNHFITDAYNNGVIDSYKSVTAFVDVSDPSYTYVCTGEIYGGASFYSPIVESITREC